MKVHFKAGGSVMHQPAHRDKAWWLSGRDDEIFEPARIPLTEAGLSATNGWVTSHIIPELETVIPGVYAQADHPELVGAAKRPELFAEQSNMVVFRDFAQALSKLTVSIQTVNHQFPQRKLPAGFALRDNNNLNSDFLLRNICIHLTKRILQRLCIPVMPLSERRNRAECAASAVAVDFVRRSCRLRPPKLPTSSAEAAAGSEGGRQRSRGNFPCPCSMTRMN